MIVFLLSAILLVLLVATGLHEPVFRFLLKILKWILIVLAVVLAVSFLIYIFPTTNEIKAMPLFNFDYGLIIQWGVIAGFAIGIPYILAVIIYDFLKFLHEKWKARK
jgi:H+/gluconate symporter-like permease